EQLVLAPLDEVCGVDERERQRREQLTPLAPTRRRANDGRGIPLAVDDEVAGRSQPLGEEHELRALARAVHALDHEQLAGERPRATVERRAHDPFPLLVLPLLALCALR